MSPALAAASGMLVFAAAWELAGMGRPPALVGAAEVFRARFAAGGEWAARLGIERRLGRAGLADRVTPRGMLAAKAASTLIGGTLALSILPVAPTRLAPVLVAGLVTAGFLAPDALVERRARRRSAQVIAALPDVLDLLAVGAGAGRAPAVMLAEVSHASGGPLATELATTTAEVRTGASPEQALGAMRDRLEIPELGVLVATLERSRRYGSPLAEQLHARAAALRAEERRRIEERAARAAPKIQLVVALLLVPSALLSIAAALIAHSGTLFQALR